MTPKRTKRPAMNVRELSVVRSQAHLRWVRGFGCCVCCLTDPRSQPSPSEAAHVRRGTNGGTGMKPGDNWSIPLCSDHHREQHSIGEASFAERYQIELKETASMFWEKSPAGIKYRGLK